MTFAWIGVNREEFPVRVMCETLGVSVSGFYASQQHAPGPRQKRRSELKTRIGAVHAQARGVYGSPRVHRELIA